jgi:hypothetical protein
MRIAVNARARQPGAVDQAGVVQGVGKNRVVGAHQGGNDADIGGVTGVKIKGARELDEAGQRAFQSVVGGAVTADQG